MAFSIANLMKSKPQVGAPKTDQALLNNYADFDINAMPTATGERGIVVLSLNGEEPIFAQTEEYDIVVEKKNNARKGLAGTASTYQAEQAELANMNAEARTVSYDVLFDAEESDNEEWLSVIAWANDWELSLDGESEYYERKDFGGEEEESKTEGDYAGGITGQFVQLCSVIDEVQGTQSYETKGFGECKTDGVESTREPVDLTDWPLHRFIPGLGFLPGIGILKNIEVRNVRVEYGTAVPVLPAKSDIFDDIDACVEENYMDDEACVSPTLFETDTAQQVTGIVSGKSLNHAQSETWYQHEEEDDCEPELRMEPVYFYDIATGHDIGFTAINHLLDPEVEEAERQIHRAEDDFEDEDLSHYGVAEITSTLNLAAPRPDDSTQGSAEDVDPNDEEPGSDNDESEVSIPEGMEQIMFSSWRKPNARGPYPNNTRGWRPVDMSTPISEAASPAWFSVHDSNSEQSIDFSSHRDTVKPRDGRRSNFLSDDEESEHAALSEEDALEVKQDVEALFDGAFWRNNIAVDLTFSFGEAQRIDLPHAVEIFSEIPSTPVRPEPSSRSASSITARSSIASVNGFEVTMQALNAFTVEYVSQLRQGNAYYMFEMRNKIQEDYDGEQAFGLGEQTVNDISWFVRRIYSASSVHAQETPEDPDTLLGSVLWLVNDMKGAAHNDAYTQSLVERVWETAFSCMASIEKAHREMLAKPGMLFGKYKLADEVAQTERALWNDWVYHIRESVGDGEDSEVLLQEFLWASVHWWYAEAAEGIRRREGSASG